MFRLLARQIAPVSLAALTALASTACSDNTLSQLAAASTTTPQTFTDRLDGRLTQRGPGSNGLIRIQISANLHGDVRGRLRVTLWGTASESGGVALETSDVAFGAAGTTSPYVGSVVGLNGNLIDARLKNSAGGRIALRMAVNVDTATGNVSGELRGQAG